MKYAYLLVVFICFNALGSGQNGIVDTTKVDDKYREDQFYVSVSYNLLGRKPSGVSQNGFSSGFHFGFIRDMPINKSRNKAIGLGFGFSTNSYNQTLLISENSDQTIAYSILDKSSTAYSKNKFSTYLFEVPLEIRWRTSNAVDYNFWRLYTGFKMGYLIYNSSKFKSNDGNILTSNISDFNKVHYGLTLSAGYSNINFYFYYALNDIFKKEVMVGGQDLGMNAVKIGLIYYIL